MLCTTAPLRIPLSPSSRLTQTNRPAQRQVRQAQHRLSEAQHRRGTAQHQVRTAPCNVRTAQHTVGTAQHKLRTMQQNFRNTQHRASQAQQRLSSNVITRHLHRGKAAVSSRLTGLLMELAAVTQVRFLLIKLHVLKMYMLPCVLPVRCKLT